jgi:mitochondrial import inner membrane translocase subunit TIM50
MKTVNMSRSVVYPLLFNCVLTLYQQDLSYLNRPLSKVILLDTKAIHAKNQPENAIIIPPWKGDPQDKELLSYIPFLEYIAAMGISDVRDAIESFDGKHIPTEYARRETALREKFNREMAAKKSKPNMSIGGLICSALGMKPQGGMITEEGKSLPDQIHESGMKQYEAMEKQIREQGAEWLKEQAEAEKKAQENQMKTMRSRFLNFWGNGEEDNNNQPTTANPGKA